MGSPGREESRSVVEVVWLAAMETLAIGAVQTEEQVAFQAGVEGGGQEAPAAGVEREAMSLVLAGLREAGGLLVAAKWIATVPEFA